MRLLKGVTQKDVASAVGVKRATVTQWEQGRFRPSQEKITALDAYLEADGALIALGGRPEPAPETPFATAAEILHEVGDCLVDLGTAGEKGVPIGWPHRLGGTGAEPSALSTAYGIRTMLLLDRADLDLPALAALLAQKQLKDPLGAWSYKAADTAGPEVTAVVLSALARIGSGGADIDAAWSYIGEATMEEPYHPFVLSTVIESIAPLRPPAGLVKRLSEKLLDIRVEDGGQKVWGSAAPDPGNSAADLIKPKVASTARAVLALKTAIKFDPETRRLAADVEKAVEWLTGENFSLTQETEVLRMHKAKVSIDHFTAALVLRALADTYHRGGRLWNETLRVFWDSYLPNRHLWSWGDNRLPMWMNYDAVLAVLAVGLASISSAHPRPATVSDSAAE